MDDQDGDDDCGGDDGDGQFQTIVKLIANANQLRDGNNFLSPGARA